jgi:hypothetical protein
MKFKILHLMIQEYDNVLSRNKVIYRKKYYKALEYHHQVQKQELLEMTFKNEPFLVKEEPKLILKEFENHAQINY